MKKIKICGVAIMAAIASVACSDGNKWTVKGEVSPEAAENMVVESLDNGRWYVLDTVKVDKDGSFKYSHEAAGYPDVYRLRADSLTIYFPIDSLDVVAVSHGGNGYRISGSQQAEMMMQADSIMASEQQPGDMKNALARLILKDPASITAYYVINRKIEGKAVFDPADKTDLRVIGAVANAFNDKRPSDPRTPLLTRIFFEGRRNAGMGKSVELNANEIGAPEINLYDNNGERRSLSQVASQGNVVILNFTSYAAEASPAFNVMLNNLYEKYHGRGMEIFQVAADENEYEWKRVADNLPWITVLNDVHDSGRVFINYNVGSLPAIFILNRNGEVVERVTDLNELELLVAKYL